MPPAFQAPTVLETPTTSPDVAIAAFAPLPKPFGDLDRQRLGVAVRVLSDGTAEYSRSKIFAVTEGRSVEASLLPDGVLIRLTLPKGNLRNGLAIMEGLLRRPTLVQEHLDAALTRLQRRDKDYWSAALNPQGNVLKKVSADEERGLLQRVFQPTRSVVAVLGGFEAGTASAIWSQRTADWKPTPEPRYPDITPAPDARDNPSGITTVELRGTPIPLDDSALPARWLALVALGVGKGSALFRDVRQVEGWSYRQEAILWPAADGLVPRLVAASTPDQGEASRAEGLRATLRKAVDAWTENDRLRALAMAEIVLKQGVPLGPLWLDTPVSGSITDRASLDAYWFAKAGLRWSPDRLLGTMANVSLEKLKAEADALLVDAKPIVLPGR